METSVGLHSETWPPTETGQRAWLHLLVWLENANIIFTITNFMLILFVEHSIDLEVIYFCF